VNQYFCLKCVEVSYFGDTSKVPASVGYDILGAF